MPKLDTVVALCSLLFGLGLAANQDAHAFRCSGGLISAGDSKLLLLKKCGEPSWIDRWAEQIVEFPNTDFEHRITRVNERWGYNPGPTRFMRILVFRNGDLVSIRTGERGFMR